MSKDETQTDAGRRGFLKAAAIAPVAVAAVAATGTEATAAPTPAASGTVQDTAHVRAYYQSARF